MTKRYTENAEAYQLYLKGRYHWNKRTGEGLNRGIQYFQQAIEKDPGYALAYSGLADCYNLLSLYGALPPKEAMPKAKAAAQQGLEIDESLAEAHNSLAYAKLYYDWDWNGAEREFQRALELEANFIMAHFILGLTYLQKGRLEQSAAELQKAIALSGDSPLTLALGVQGYVSAVSGRKDGAHRILKKLKALSRQRYVSSYSLAIVYTGLGEKDAAFASLQGAYEERHDRLIYLNVEPIFDSIRLDPRFRDLLRPIGLERKSSKAAGKY
jgi:tetratricopeptide (TPR) repeat protein